MKKIFLITLITLTVYTAAQAVPGEVNFSKDASYAIGLNIGASLREGMTADSVYPDIDEFLMGMRDGINDKFDRFDLETARHLIDVAFAAVTEKILAAAMQKETDYLAENARRPGVQRTQSGLQYQIITDRRGVRPTARDTVLVHYEAKLTDGTIFDSSYERGEPTVFELNNVIDGFIEGLQLMSVGSKYIFTIPSALAYGEVGQKNHWTGETIIPPFAVLIFEVELLQINP